MRRSVVSAMAANMMLVQCNSDVPISLACSAEAGNSPDHGIIGTASRLGTSKFCGQTDVNDMVPM